MNARPAIFRRVAGVTLTLGSVIGLVLAIGNLLSLEHTPLKLLAQFRDMHATWLAETGLPPEVIDQFKQGQAIGETQRTALSTDHLRTVDLLEQMMMTTAAAIEVAAAQSRRRSFVAIGICAVALPIGILCIARGKHKPRSTPEGSM